MQDCKISSTPFDNTPATISNDTSNNLVDKNWYQSVIGSLLYLSTGTRPDISTAVGILARNVVNPTSQNVKSLKHLLRHLKGALNTLIEFNKTENTGIIAYSDSDWGGDTVDRKSTSGHIIFINGCPVAWRSNKQQVIALSTVEAECIAGAETASTIVWIRRLWKSLGNNICTPTKLWMDNQGAIKLSENGQASRRTRHIDIKYFFITSLITTKQITIDYKPTNYNCADIMTKALDSTKFKTHCEFI
ncbi:unnamed protein product [Rotaria socialis]|uniref:Uncharacterized protein n=1 Tax=Rotaria socialis TaxID=392032 RepID=A0A821W477_9BILA|nr:unnamed protein product [Rotaria socialis]CAF4916688.1 unnamed protein product [Rotaria socialis]